MGGALAGEGAGGVPWRGVGALLEPRGGSGPGGGDYSALGGGTGATEVHREGAAAHQEGVCQRGGRRAPAARAGGHELRGRCLRRGVKASPLQWGLPEGAGATARGWCIRKGRCACLGPMRGGVARQVGGYNALGGAGVESPPGGGEGPPEVVVGWSPEVAGRGVGSPGGRRGTPGAARTPGGGDGG
ncbi:hypothetical protein NE237_029663 [Protea cynaroides]|uniref:Uncharacterized protein n=1 Tax=Protea cynaroides TaxID=273540 RepID=A0A9Q0JV09_9MAGN|nr:hypothetical protein NE237_029663 [Protea cynaroides]